MRKLPGRFEMNDIGHIIFAHSDGRTLVPYGKEWYLANKGDATNVIGGYRGKLIQPWRRSGE